MGFLLDRNKPADWTKDPTVPAPVEPVKAAAQPGAVREGFQTLYSLIWSKLRGQVTYGAMQIEVGGGDGSVPFPALTATEGLRVVLRREQHRRRVRLLAHGVVAADDRGDSDQGEGDVRAVVQRELDGGEPRANRQYRGGTGQDTHR